MDYLDAAARACEREMAALRLGSGATIEETRLRDARGWSRIGPLANTIVNPAGMTDEAVIVWSMSHAQPWAWIDERVLFFGPDGFESMLARLDAYFKELSSRNERSQFKKAPYRTPFGIRGEWDELRENASLTRLTIRFGVRAEGAEDTPFLAHVYFFQIGDRVGVHSVLLESFDLYSPVWFVL